MGDLIVLTVPQGSPEWHETRRKHRPASVTPMIMGTSKFGGLTEAYRSLTGEYTVRSAAVEHGSKTEPRARARLQAMLGIVGEPVVGIRDRYLASLDFLGDGVAVEIKCPFAGWRSSTWVEAEAGRIEPGYRDQMEHQRHVFRPEKQFLFVYISDEENLLVEYTGDDDRWAAIHEKWEWFEAVYVPQMAASRDDPDWVTAAAEYIRCKSAFDQAERSLQAAKDRLIALSGGKRAAGAGVTVNHVSSAGQIDYKAALAKLAPDADLEAFRKPGKVYATVSLEKEG